MVYCTRCGKENEEDARFCVNCGANLYPVERREKKEEICFRPERRVEEECFGFPYGGTIAGIVFGLFIIIVGVAILLGQDVWRLIWPFTVIIFGILVVAGAIYRMSRRPRSQQTSLTKGETAWVQIATLAYLLMFKLREHNPGYYPVDD